MSHPENESQAPAARWSLIGPGIVVAATGVGAGDLVATLIAGSRFGYALLWAALAGTVIKIALAEGVGRSARAILILSLIHISEPTRRS